MRKATTEKKPTFDDVDNWRKELFKDRSLLVAVDELGKWPLRNYLWASVLQAMAIHEERDSMEANWQTPAWDFGRFAKAHPDLFKLGENEALALVQKTIGTSFWHTNLDMERADAEMAFIDIWANCRAVPGYDPLTVAVMEGRQATAGFQEGPAGYETFIEIARSLHRQLNGAPFMLPCHKLAPMLGCKAMTVSRYRQKALREGVLKVSKEHTFSSIGRGEATEFVLA